MRMLKKMRPTPGTAIAMVALVAAMGGTAYAATKIDTKDIAPSAIKSRLVDNGTLNSKDIKNDTIKGADVKDDAFGAQQVDEESLGLETRWLLLNEQGQIEDQSGGFTVIDAYDTNANAYIDTGESLVGKGLTATIALQNQIDLDEGTAGTQGNFAGEVSISRCQIPGVVECAPDGAKNEGSFAVSPRNSDGSPAATASPVDGPGTSTKRIYIQITE